MKLYGSLSDRLKTQHESIQNIIIGIDSNRMLTRPQPGKWNIHDNLAHLTSYQPVFIERIKQILLEENPVFGRYKADDDPDFINCQMLDTDAMIKKIDADRNIIYELINDLTDDQLNRTGTHKKYGALNIVEWTEFFLLHEAHHIFTIFQLAHDVDL